MTNIRETVARAIVAEQMKNHDVHGTSLDEAHAAITAFLETAAEEGWHMRRDEATEEMINVAAETPKIQAVNGAITLASVHGFNLEPSEWHNSPIADAYRAMNEVAAKFEWDK